MTPPPPTMLDRARSMVRHSERIVEHNRRELARQRDVLRSVTLREERMFLEASYQVLEAECMVDEMQLRVWRGLVANLEVLEQRKLGRCGSAVGS